MLILSKLEPTWIRVIGVVAIVVIVVLFLLLYVCMYVAADDGGASVFASDKT